MPQDMAMLLSKSASVPIFGSYDTGLGAGVIGGSMVSAQEIATRAGLVAVDILKGRKSSGNRIEPTRRYDLTINTQACSEQGLPVPETVKARATRIINKIANP